MADRAYALTDRRLGGVVRVHASREPSSCMGDPRKRVEAGHQQMRLIAHGDPTLPSFREHEAMQIENEAVQIEARGDAN